VFIQVCHASLMMSINDMTVHTTYMMYMRIIHTVCSHIVPCTFVCVVLILIYYCMCACSGACARRTTSRDNK